MNIVYLILCVFGASEAAYLNPDSEEDPGKLHLSTIVIGIRKSIQIFSNIHN